MTPSIYEAYERRMVARLGYRPSRAVRCPRVVAGLRCRHITTRGLECPCACDRFQVRLFDHARMWYDARSRAHVLTGEPYDFNPEDLAAFVATDGHALRLRVEVSKGLWKPGSTTLVIVRRANGTFAAGPQ